MRKEATFPGGFSIAPATQADIDYVEDNFRAGERREREVEDAPRTMLDDFESCWTIRAANGDVIGYFGVLVMPAESFLSRTRAFCFMSCTNTDRHKVAFVKATRPIFRWVVAACPPWTERYITWPLESYAASVRWQERILGMRRIGRVPAGNGECYIVMELTRREVETW